MRKPRKKTKKKGRPALEGEYRGFSVYLKEEQIAWLSSQPGSRNDVVRRLIETAMKGESK